MVVVRHTFASPKSWKMVSQVNLKNDLSYENDFLKPMYAILYQILIFSPNDSPSKTMKNVFYFIQKALFILKIFKFL